MSKISAHMLSSIHAYLLVIMGVWAFFDTGSKAQFLLVILGVPILTMNNGVRYSDKSSTRVALFFTVIASVVAGMDVAGLVSKGAALLPIVKSSILLTVGGASTVLLLAALRKVASVG